MRSKTLIRRYAQPLRTPFLATLALATVAACSSGGDNKAPSQAARSEQVTFSLSSDALSAGAVSSSPLSVSSGSNSSVITSPSSSLSAGVSSSSGTPAPVEPTPAAGYVLLKGNVVKGLVANAAVSLHAVREGEIVSAPMAEVITDEFGEFFVEIPATNMPKAIYAVARARDSETTMLCDATICSLSAADGDDLDGDGSIGLGEPLSLGDDFVLSGLFMHSHANRWQTSITPWSHFALEQAISRSTSPSRLSLARAEHYFSSLAYLLRLPATLDNQTAAMPGSRFFDASDAEALLYGIYASALANKALEDGRSIADTLASVASSLLVEGGVSRGVLNQLLDASLNNATAWSDVDQDVASTINPIQLTRNYYRCSDNSALDNCDDPNAVVRLPAPPSGPIDPVPPTTDYLPEVKAFVADTREWLRAFAQVEDLPLRGLQTRGYWVAELWDEDLSEFGDSLNGVLKAIGQLVSPHYAFCFECENEGQPSLIFDGSVLEYEGLTLTLQNDGFVTVVGTRNDIGVSLELQIPDRYTFQETQRIEILSGLLFRGDTTLVLYDGSAIEATYPFYETFESIASQLASPFRRTSRPSQLTLEANFGIESTFEIVPSDSISFETGEDLSDFRGSWQVDSRKASEGSRSYRARRISDSQRSSTELNFNTGGGLLSFDYAIDSERSYDYLNVYLDGARILRQSGQFSNFRTFSRNISPGRHTLKFEYTKDGSVSNGADTAWIDNLVLPQPIASANGATEIVTRPVMSGFISATAYQVDSSTFAINNYRPGNLSIEATLDNRYSVMFGDTVSEAGDEQVTLSLSATLANATTFTKPSPLREDTLVELGRYGIEDDVFVHTVNGFETRIQQSEFNTREYNVTTRIINSNGTGSPDTSYRQFVSTSDLLEAAARIIRNSGIGQSILVFGEGLYITTLLDTSPRGFYPDSQFNAEGGVVYGILEIPDDGNENAEQYLQLSASAELTLSMNGIGPFTLGVDLDRLSVDAIDLDVYVASDDNRLNVAANTAFYQSSFLDDDIINLETPKLTLTNPEGVMLDIWLEQNIDAKNSSTLDNLRGTLIYKGQVYGRLERARNLTLIRYSDGTGESIE